VGGGVDAAGDTVVAGGADAAGGTVGAITAGGAVTAGRAAGAGGTVAAAGGTVLAGGTVAAAGGTVLAGGTVAAAGGTVAAAGGAVSAGGLAAAGGCVFCAGRTDGFVPDAATPSNESAHGSVDDGIVEGAGRSTGLRLEEGGQAGIVCSVGGSGGQMSVASGTLLGAGATSSWSGIDRT
jgi:hypothetical protein